MAFWECLHTWRVLEPRIVSPRELSAHEPAEMHGAALHTPAIKYEPPTSCISHHLGS